MIEKFDSIVSPISELRSHYGLLKDSLSQTFTHVFRSILEKCALSSRVTNLGVLAHKFSDLLNSSCTLTLLTIDDLEKLDRYREISASEGLFIIGKSYKIIHTNKIKAGDPLS